MTLVTCQGVLSSGRLYGLFSAVLCGYAVFYPMKSESLTTESGCWGIVAGVCMILFYLLWISPVLLHAQEYADAEVIRGLEMKWADAYKSRQLDALSSLIDDAYIITFEDGSVHGKVGLFSHAAKPSEHVDVADFSDVKIRMHGDAAVVTGSYHEAGDSNGKHYDYNDRFTDVWIKAQGKWKLIASHYSIPAQ